MCVCTHKLCVPAAQWGIVIPGLFQNARQDSGSSSLFLPLPQGGCSRLSERGFQDDISPEPWDSSPVLGRTFGLPTTSGLLTESQTKAVGLIWEAFTEVTNELGSVRRNWGARVRIVGNGVFWVGGTGYSGEGLFWISLLIT